MCIGVEYRIGERDVKVYFPNPRATLPVQRPGGEVGTVPWGRRKEQLGSLPLGGWARRESIHAGTWDKYNKKPVRIFVGAFAEKDYAGKTLWYPVTPGYWIQGLLARIGDEERVYVVTIEPETDLEKEIHDRWPRVLTG